MRAPIDELRFVLSIAEMEEICQESFDSEFAVVNSHMSRYISRPKGRLLRTFSSIGKSKMSAPKTNEIKLASFNDEEEES